MPIAILIVFEYEHKPLTGAIIDLYHAYKWCKSFNCKINVFTDIEYIKDSSILEAAFEKNIVEDDIMTFYENIDSKYIVNNSSELLSELNNILDISKDNKIIIYYSGHGVENNAIMPNKELFSFISFRNKLLDLFDSYTEIFWILDCCNPNGLNLPFKLKNNSFELSSSQIECVTQPILLLTSSNSNEKSIASKFGSIFSKSLFTFLSNIDTDRNLTNMINSLSNEINILQTGYTQTISLYSSYVINPVLWMWIGSVNNYDIVSDMSLSILILRR